MGRGVFGRRGAFGVGGRDRRVEEWSSRGVGELLMEERGVEMEMDMDVDVRMLRV